jgi:energy-coupling factor transport system ATP-binding protein
MLEYSDRCIVLDDGQIIADKSPVEVLTDTKLIARANLKETSLFTLAKKFGLSEPQLFVAQFIAYDRRVLGE